MSSHHRVAWEKLARVKTKIVATVGPASEPPETLRELILAGVDVFRLNFAHGQHDRLDRIVADIRRIAQELARPVALLGDLAGPKIRLEPIPGDVRVCEIGRPVEFLRDPDPSRPEALACTYKPLVDEVQVGDQLVMADGAVTVQCVSKHPAEGRIVCSVVQPGEVRSRQGINLPGVTLSTPSLTDKDQEDLAWAIRQELDFVGLSFVRKADDIRQLHDLIRASGTPHPPLIVAKIEKIEALRELEAIVDLADCVMVARGDLGVEVDLALVPIYQKQIIRTCNARRVPVITATQMLESMLSNSRPTRAEASDVANAVLDGTDAVMLSGETAVGQYPVVAVATMSRIVSEIEKILPARPSDNPLGYVKSRALQVTESVVLGATRAAEHLPADLIVVATHSGRTALAISRQRSLVPILGLTDSPAVARQMCLYWGVTPLVTDKVHASPQELLAFAVAWSRQHHVLTEKGKLVLVGSSNWSADGHDTLLVHAVGN